MHVHTPHTHTHTHTPHTHTTHTTRTHLTHTLFAHPLDLSLLCHCSALQIFQKESHPSSYKLGSGTKEGLSLFGESLALHACALHSSTLWSADGASKVG